MIIRVIFSRPNTQAEFELGGAPNGTCTTINGSNWLHPDKRFPNVWFCFLNEKSESVKQSVANNFRDIRSLGEKSDITQITILPEYNGREYDWNLDRELYEKYADVVL